MKSKLLLWVASGCIAAALGIVLWGIHIWRARHDDATTEEVHPTAEHPLVGAGPVEMPARVGQDHVTDSPNDVFRRALSSLGDSESDLAQVRRLVGEWGAYDPQAAAAWLLELAAGAKKNESLRALAGAWGKKDEGGFHQWIVNLPQDSLKDRAAVQLAQALARTDPASATEVLQWISEKALKAGLYQEIAPHWAAKDARAVQRWLLTLPAGPERDNAIMAAARTLTSNEPEEVAALMAYVKNEDLRLQVLPYLISEWTRTNPVAAAQWLLGLPAGQLRDRAAYEFVVNVDETQGAIAFEWALTIQDEHSRWRAMSNAMHKWARHDPSAASEWLNQLSPGPARDSAVLWFVGGIQITYPVDAVQWAMSIEDVSLRQQSVKETLVRWLHVDRPAAEAWLNSAPLSEATKQEILKKAEKESRYHTPSSSTVPPATRSCVEKSVV